ncbi:hypothetical protein C8J57DRAFT_1401892 [Mycena rebaudengoi]|nr:hypothetical protein C8J57DRAFT_1401892 [Mycena rebaudengoi]
MSYTYSYLPPELERKIFEIAATDHPKTIPTPPSGCSTGPSVPLLYRTPVMGPVMTLTFRDLLRAIPLCEGLQTLQLFNVGILGALQKMQLRVQRVSIIKREDLQSIDLASLPSTAADSLRLALARIANWTTLHVWSIRSGTPPSWDRRRDSEHQSTYVDPRCVLMFYPTEPGPWVDDWEVGAAGGNDFWARAEVLINKRRRGEIEPGMFYVITAFDPITTQRERA